MGRAAGSDVSEVESGACVAEGCRFEQAANFGGEGLNGRTTTACSYFVTSRPAARLGAPQLRQLRRRQWGIESTCHQQLDVSLHEDRSRVRSVSSVAVLGVLSRISLAFFQQDCRRPQPVRDNTFPVWSGRLQRQPRPMLDRLFERCLPP